MRLGVLGLITGDLTDVGYDKVRLVTELGFTAVGIHLSVPAEDVGERVIANTRAALGDQDIGLLQLWGAYPCIISPDESVRREGVAQAREIVRLAAKLGARAAGVRPTSLNPRGDWWPHPDNFKPATRERFLHSLREILATAVDEGVEIVLETHQTTLLNTPQTIKAVIEETGPEHVRVNIDPVNFIDSLQTAFDPAPTIHEVFDVLGPYAGTVHLKDIQLEDRFVVHIAETVLGTGIMDLNTVLRRTQALLPDGYAMIEHLPVNLIPLAKRNLDRKLLELDIPVY